jgi:hypothetical protein
MTPSLFVEQSIYEASADNGHAHLVSSLRGWRPDETGRPRRGGSARTSARQGGGSLRRFLPRAPAEQSDDLNGAILAQAREIESIRPR